MTRGIAGLSLALAAGLGLAPRAGAAEDPVRAAAHASDAHAHAGDAR